MSVFNELGVVEQQTQQDIQKSFSEYGSKLGRLVFSRQLEENALKVWREPGFIVALETRTDTEIVEKPLFEGEVLAQAILEVVANTTKLTPSLIQSPSKKANLVEARHIAMYLVRRHAKLSYPKIGKLLGGLDHSSVIYAVRKIEKLINETTPEKHNNTKARVGRIEGRLAELYESKILVPVEEVHSKILEAVATTREGLYAYPTSSLDVKFARALRLPSDEIVLDWDKRNVSEELLKAYGSITLSLMGIEKT